MKKSIPILVLMIMAAMLVISWSNVLNYKSDILKEYNDHIAAADAYMEKEIYIDAVKEYEAALEMKPENYELAMKIADIYLELDNKSGYIQSCEKAITADKTQLEPYLLIADYYMGINSYSNANEILLKAQKAVDSDEITKRLIEIRGRYSLSSIGYDVVFSIYYPDGSDVGYQKVKNGDYYGLISTSGSLIAKYEYEDVGLLSDNVIPVKKDGEYYYINKNGYRKLVPDEKADFLGTFGSGYAPAEFNGVYGYVDSKMKQYKVEYDYAGCFSNGIAAVKKGDKWNVINSSFEKVVSEDFEDVLIDDYGYCSTYGVFWAKKGGKYYLYSKDGKELAGGFDDAKLFASKEPAAFKQNGKWGFVSIDGKTVIEPEYDDANSFCVGYAPFCKDSLWGCIDSDANVVIEPLFTSMESFVKNGSAIVTDENGTKEYLNINIY